MIYTPGSIPAGRFVFVDGKEVNACFFADTTKGVVKFYRMPLRVDKHRKRALSYTLRGVVEVTE